MQNKKPDGEGEGDDIDDDDEVKDEEGADFDDGKSVTQFLATPPILRGGADGGVSE